MRQRERRIKRVSRSLSFVLRLHDRKEREPYFGGEKSMAPQQALLQTDKACLSVCPSRHLLEKEEILALQIVCTRPPQPPPPPPKRFQSCRPFLPKNTNNFSLKFVCTPCRKPAAERAKKLCEDYSPASVGPLFSFQPSKYSVINMRQARIPSCESPLYQGRFH
jgi:hypothetical protein